MSSWTLKFFNAHSVSLRQPSSIKRAYVSLLDKICPRVLPAPGVDDKFTFDQWWISPASLTTFELIFTAAQRIRTGPSGEEFSNQMKRLVFGFKHNV